MIKWKWFIAVRVTEAEHGKTKYIGYYMYTNGRERTYVGAYVHIMYIIQESTEA